MTALSFKDRLAQLLPVSLGAYLASHTDAHRKFLGPEDSYDLAAASQFNLLTMLGLREAHSVLDICCGGLRAGRPLICYLQPGRYFGLEPEKWVLEAAGSCFVATFKVGEEITRATNGSTLATWPIHLNICKCWPRRRD